MTTLITAAEETIIRKARQAFVLIQKGRTIGHVRYINILTWLRGFQGKRNMKNLQFRPESLGPMPAC